MQELSYLRKIGTIAGLCRVAMGVILISLLAPTASAAPVTYTGFMITDGKIGSWEFHNARVYLTFQSDTNYVQFVHIPIDPNDPNCKNPTNPPPCTVDVHMNQTGTASVTIISDRKVVHATFASWTATPWSTPCPTST